MNDFIFEMNIKILPLSNISLGNAILVFGFIYLSTNKMMRMIIIIVTNITTKFDFCLEQPVNE